MLQMDRIGVWSANLEQIPAGQACEVAAELESLGYGALWIPEVAGRDPFVHLTFLLSATARIVGATGIANIWGRDAVTMMGCVNSLTEAFPERVLIGLGVSHQNLVEGLRQHTYDKPLSAMRRYLEAMERSPYQGARPTTPVRLLLGALGPGMLRLAADRTDGAHPYLVPPEYTAAARGVLGDDPMLCVPQMVFLDTDPGSAREEARRRLPPYLVLPNYRNNLRRLGYDDDDFEAGGSDRLVDALVAWGTVEDCTARVRAHLDAGASHVCVQALGGGRGDVPMSQWRRLAPALLALG